MGFEGKGGPCWGLFRCIHGDLFIDEGDRIIPKPGVPPHPSPCACNEGAAICGEGAVEWGGPNEEIPRETVWELSEEFLINDQNSSGFRFSP